MLPPRFALLSGLVAVMLGSMSHSYAQEQRVPPAYVYCSEASQRLYVAVKRPIGLTLNLDAIGQVAHEWSIDRGLVLLHFESDEETRSSDQQVAMSETLDAVVDHLVKAGVDRRVIYERPASPNKDGGGFTRELYSHMAFILLPNRGTSCARAREGHDNVR